MTQVPLGTGGEFDRVRAIAAALDGVLGPIGDDTAVIPDGDGTLVVSIDASVEDVHFRRGWLTLEEVGWRATAGALSDLAAAAANPVGLVAAIVVPRKAGQDELVELMRGVGAATGHVGARILGGDLTSGKQWAVVITVFGRAARRMSRVGAAVGDGIWVTGTIGGARAALQAWTASIEPDADARRAFAHPLPRIAAATWLAEHGATAMMDLSDGLGGDAEHLAAASGVQLQVELECLPLHGSVAAAAHRIGEAPELFAARAGEDYELLVTMPGGFTDAAGFASANGIALTRIGAVAGGRGVRATRDGNVHAVQGFRHAV